MGGACGAYGGRQAFTGFWWGKTKGNRPLVRPRPRWEDNIKMDFMFEFPCIIS